MRWAGPRASRPRPSCCCGGSCPLKLGRSMPGTGSRSTHRGPTARPPCLAPCVSNSPTSSSRSAWVRARRRRVAPACSGSRRPVPIPCSWRASSPCGLAGRRPISASRARKTGARWLASGSRCRRHARRLRTSAIAARVSGCSASIRIRASCAAARLTGNHFRIRVRGLQGDPGAIDGADRAPGGIGPAQLLRRAALRS